MLPIAVIAGGLGTRLLPVTETIPKALISVGGRPFVDLQLEVLKRGGFSRIVFCVGYLGEMIESYVGDGRNHGLEITYAYDGPQRLGTAGALKKALPQLGDAFFTIYGDSYLRCDFSDIEKAFFSAQTSALMTVWRNDGELAPSNVQYADGRVEAYDKRHPTPQMCYIDYGVSVYARRAFDSIPSGVPADLGEVITRLVAAQDLAGYVVPERFYEVGTPQSVAELESFIGEGLHIR